MAEVLIRGGRIVDELGERDGDVLVGNDLIVAVEESIDPPAGALVLDAAGLVVSPGFVDLHTHLREPGDEVAETIETGARAAALGGFTAVVAMPNTEPPIDSASVARDVLELGRKAVVEVAVAGAITLGRRGEELAPLGELAGLGVRLFTDDGAGVGDTALMRTALEYASDLGVVLAEHCEDPSLSRGGHMHEGAWSSRLGIAGQPALAEELMLSRDIGLVRLTRSPMHFLHLSSAGSVELVRQAKAEGLPVTAEVTPHHLLLTDENVAAYDPLFKVNPPLREAGDRDALRCGLCDGAIDAIATDHAPHRPERKEAPFDEAAFGMLGLETAFSAARLALCDVLPLAELIGALSWRPARIGGFHPSSGGRHGGPLQGGAPANLTVLDPDQPVDVDPSRLASRSRNTPYGGMRLRGRVLHTIVDGELVVLDGEAQR